MYNPGDRVRILFNADEDDDSLPKVNGKLGTVIADDRATPGGWLIEVAIDDTPNPIVEDEGWLFVGEELEPVDA